SAAPAEPAPCYGEPHRGMCRPANTHANWYLSGCSAAGLPPLASPGEEGSWHSGGAQDGRIVYGLHGEPQGRKHSSVDQVNHKKRARMDTAALTILHNQILSGSGDPFSLLCQLKSWVEGELSSLSQEMIQKYARLILNRQNITELISDE